MKRVWFVDGSVVRADDAASTSVVRFTAVSGRVDDSWPRSIVQETVASEVFKMYGAQKRWDMIAVVSMLKPYTTLGDMTTRGRVAGSTLTMSVISSSRIRKLEVFTGSITVLRVLTTN
jgi:hypothetical protein